MRPWIHRLPRRLQIWWPWSSPVVYLDVGITELDGNVPLHIVLELYGLNSAGGLDRHTLAMGDVSDGSNVYGCLMGVIEREKEEGGRLRDEKWREEGREEGRKGLAGEDKKTKQKKDIRTGDRDSNRGQESVRRMDVVGR